MAQLEDLCAALLKTVQTNTKSDAVPTEIKRNNDCHASALRAIIALRAIDDSAKPMVDMIAALKGSEKTAPRWANAIAGHNSNSNNTVMSP